MRVPHFSRRQTASLPPEVRKVRRLLVILLGQTLKKFKPSSRVETLKKFLEWVGRQPKTKSDQALLDWLRAKPALVLFPEETEALAAALWASENGVPLPILVHDELHAKSILPEEFGYEDIERLLALHPAAIKSGRVMAMLSALLMGDGVNGAPVTTPKTRHRLLRALERGQRQITGDAGANVARAQKIWKMVGDLRAKHWSETRAVASVAKRLKMTPHMVRKNVTVGRRIAGATVHPVGRTRKRKKLTRQATPCG